MPVNATGLLLTDDWIKGALSDPLAAVKTLDVKTVAMVGVGVMLVVLAIDLVAFLLASVSGNRRSFAPLSTSALEALLHHWRRPHHIEAHTYLEPAQFR